MTDALRGRRVLVTRPASRAAALLSLLRDSGAEPVAAPTITTVTEAAQAAVTAAAELADGLFDWVAFTSATAVDALCEIAAATRTATAQVGGHAGPLVATRTRVAAVGHATAAALERAHVAVDLVPAGRQSGAALAAAWPPDGAGRTVLLPHSDLARGELAAGLRALDYDPRPVTVYRTVPRPLPAAVARDLATGRIDAVVLTSPSSCSAVADVPIARDVLVVAIGETTRAAAATSGLRVAAVAPQASAQGLMAALTHAVSLRGTRRLTDIHRESD